MKNILLLLFLLTSSIVANTDNNETSSQDNLIVVEDTSGLSEEQVRKVATDSDSVKKESVSIKEVFEVTDTDGKVDLSKLQKPWKELSPQPKKCDWIQTKSGEWFKGKIKSMYDDKLEFDSDEIGIHTFDFEDVSQIKSFHVLSTKIEDLASFEGIVRLKDDNVTIIQGATTFEFNRDTIVSFAKSGNNERNFWSGKITLNLDVRSGNRNQLEYSAQGYLDRRKSDSRLRFDYFGRISLLDETKIANNTRINEKYDIYLNRNFFITPLFGEFYQDEFQNIKYQITAGVGVGYRIINTKKLEWDISGGPAYKRTQYYTVANDDDRVLLNSPSLELNTRVEYEFSKKIDITFDAKLTYTDDAAGRYKHHMLLTFENEILSWLDLDVTTVWDRTQKPEVNSDGLVPELDDYQLLVGLGVEF